MGKITLLNLAKALQREKVPVHRKTGTFMEYRLKGTSGLMHYSDMPSQIEIRPEIVQQMNKKAEQSQAMNREISSAVNYEDEKMILGANKVGDRGSCGVMFGSMGMFHTHPGVDEKEVSDTFSLMDVITSFKFNIPIMFAQTTHNNRVWCAVKSNETESTVSKRKKVQRWEILEGQEDENIAKGFTSDKDYRGLVKKFCDEFHIKLYCGKKGHLREYQGDW